MIFNLFNEISTYQVSFEWIKWFLNELWGLDVGRHLETVIKDENQLKNIWFYSN